jgi:HSP20 family protein
MNQVVKFRPFPTTKVLANGLFDELFNRSIADFVGSDSFVSQPAVNVLESKDGFKVEVAAPGFDKHDFEINVENNILTISAKREEKTDDPAEKYTRREFRYASFKRTYKLPESVNRDAVGAVYENGILNVSLPKKEEAKPAVKNVPVG